MKNNYWFGHIVVAVFVLYLLFILLYPLVLSMRFAFGVVSAVEEVSESLEDLEKDSIRYTDSISINLFEYISSPDSSGMRKK